jgi:hypothetical protein
MLFKDRDHVLAALRLHEVSTIFEDGGRSFIITFVSCSRLNFKRNGRFVLQDALGNQRKRFLGIQRMGDRLKKLKLRKTLLPGMHCGE